MPRPIMIYRVSGELETPLHNPDKVYTGFLVQWWLLSQLEKIEPGISDKILGHGWLKPIHVSPLMVKDKPVPHDAEVGSKLWFQVSTFSNYINRMLKELMSGLEEVEVAGSRLRVESIDRIVVNPEEYKPNEPPARIVMNFLTPTYLIDSPRKRVAYKVVYPRPDLMIRFMELVGRALEIRVPRSLQQWVSEGGLVVSALKIKTVKSRIRENVYTIGFVGKASLTFLRSRMKEGLAKYAAWLLKLSEFTGIGGSRAAGHGMVKVDLVHEEEAGKEEALTIEGQEERERMA